MLNYRSTNFVIFTTVSLVFVLQVLVVGDVHGQYFDLLKILQMWRPDTRLLFLGDYVGEDVPPPFEDAVLS